MSNNSHQTEGIDDIHVVLSIYNIADDYLRHAATTILSIVLNTNRHITFHILHNNCSACENKEDISKNIDKLNKISKEYNCRIIMHEIDISNQFESLKALNKYSPGTLLRLFIPDVLHDLNKCIYLDCDIIVNLDISELWDVNIDNYPLAACKDTNFPKGLGLKQYHPKFKRIYSEIHGIRDYFNAGILILNLTHIRERYDLKSETIEFLSKTLTYHL